MTPSYVKGSVRWIAVQNVDAQPALPFALLAIAGTNNDGTLQVKRPTTDSQDGLLVNGPGSIPPQGYGSAHANSPCATAYEDNDPIPGVGDVWGSAANQWKLRQGKSGYRMLGGGSDGVINAAKTSPVPAAVVTVDGIDPGTGDPSSPPNPHMTGVSVIEVDWASGISLINDGGKAELQLQAASGTHAGAVSTSLQVFAGDKFIDGKLGLSNNTGGTGTLPAFEYASIYSHTLAATAPGVKLHTNSGTNDLGYLALTAVAVADASAGAGAGSGWFFEHTEATNGGTAVQGFQFRFTNTTFNNALIPVNFCVSPSPVFRPAFSNSATSHFVVMGWIHAEAGFETWDGANVKTGVSKVVAGVGTFTNGILTA